MPLLSKPDAGNPTDNTIDRGYMAVVRVLISLTLIIVFTFTSSAAPFETSWITTGTIQNGWFGYSISRAGDINGDGFDDVILAQTNAPDSLGKAVIYYGSAAGLPSQPGTRLATPAGVGGFAEFVEEAGDVNGDGFADVMIVASGQQGGRIVCLYYGSPAGLVTTSYWTPTVLGSADCGRQLSSAGDINNDGYSDIIFTAYTPAAGGKNEGAVWIFNGSANGPASTPSSNITFLPHYMMWDRLRISAAGDINNDGFDDIVASFPYDSQTETDAGRAQVHYGSLAGISSTPSLVINGSMAKSFLNVDSSIGDHNNDGFADVRLNDANLGRRLYRGSATGLSQAFFEIPNLRNMTPAGDVDGDGYIDIMAADSAHTVSDSQEGIAYVHYGTAGPMNWANPWIREGTERLGYFGGRISTAGDVNGDGYDDIMISEMGYPNGYCRVHVYYGAPRESKVYNWTLF